MKDLDIIRIDRNIKCVEDLENELDKAKQQNIRTRKVNSIEDIDLDKVAEVYIFCKGCRSESTALVVYENNEQEIIIDTFSCGYNGIGSRNTIELIAKLTNRDRNDHKIKEIEGKIKSPELINHALDIEVGIFNDKVRIYVVEP